MYVNKHTKGPWKNEENQIQALDFEDRYTLTIAQVDYCDHTREEDIANANLISAAPEMFALLEEAYEKLSVGHVDNPGYGYDLLKEIAIVLKKARGER